MIRALVLFLVLVLVGVFALINWDAFLMLTPLSFGFTTVKAPLGLIMLGLLAFVCVLFTVWMILVQGNALRHARRHGKELQGQRELADRAEASRIAELRSELLRRLDEHGNSTAAQLAHLEDRLEHARVLTPEPGQSRLPGHPV